MEKRKVLIIEDEEDILQFIKRILELKSCTVFGALTATEAWEIFEREKPNAIAIDVLLFRSEYDGIEFLKRVREIDKDVLCILVTRVENEEILNKAKQLGINGIFIKPPNIKEIDNLIQLLAYGKRREA